MAEMEHYPNFQKDNYIHPKAAWDKLRMAGARRQNVYLYAATGYGKTELLHRYLRRRKHIWLSGEGLTVETLQEIALPAEATMVIDDLARVLDPAVRREIVSMLNQPGLWLVLAGRCPLPSWLTGPYVNGRLSVIPEEDLRLSEKEIAQLYLSWGVQLPRNLLEKRIIPLVEGNPLGARLLAVEMSQGSSYTEELVNDLTRKFYEYLNQAIYSEWPKEIREMMMQLSLLEHFTIQQAEEMTGRSDVNRLLAQAAETGNLFSIKDGGYTLRPAVINSMKLRMETVCDRVRENELLRRAGTICEKEGNIPRALKLYQDGQCEKEIHALLIDNARRYPGGGYYYELTPAYLALPEEEVRSSPDLIAARSMLYSLALNATESERWYAVLQEYAAGHPDPEEHRLAESWLVYLDISLPHRGSTNLIEVLDEAARKIQTERLVMPEFSVTGGQPSVINGSKDFCDWTRDDQTMAFQLEKHVGEVLGPYSKGLVSIGLAESLFEKGGNIYKVLELANRGLMETMNGGKFELQFVGAALVARVYLVTGHPGDSVKTLEEIETRAQQRGVRRVVRNVRALQSRIKLWQGRVEDAVRWMENEPQDEIHFNVLERYCYNTFARVYMAQQRYDKTAQILMRLRSYANMEKRPWLQMEGDLLESIIRYRTGNPLWKTELTQVLRRAESYHFVRLFCREGAALLPLLQELGCPEGVDEAYWQEVLGKTRAMAEAYPLYLSTNALAALPGAVQLSERALQSRIKLWQGRVEDAVRWMENEPQDEIHFNVLERYCYNTFARVYMAQQRYDKTAQILMRLRSYANMEKRPWLQMEGDLLESIIRYRTGNPLWKTELTQVLRRAESYHFVRLFCREGAALLPLLQELGCPEGVDEAYWQEVLGKTRAMAEAYPLYLSTNALAALPGAVQLSERALQVLRLQDRGLTRSEIARQLQLSERSVKYQCEQAYHKLGTSNKVEALAAARKLNLLN